MAVPIAPGNGRRPLRFVLADDHNLFREALCYYLRQSSLAPEIIEAGSLG